ncbi:polyprenyl synthetase-like protein 1 [Elsinoe australis]|uniref:Polyprenyl synthetase-like protein 1 n=1 Tax=Elsinoe australis TaxID=40998 RepID=A0A4U7ATL6_9PEZI|nr:polyprenyl synthetase-like protein 1 [Elsinoe australis]
MTAGRARASALAASFAARRPQPQALQRCPGCSQPLALTSYNSPSTSLYHPPRRRHQSAVAAAVSAAKNIFNNDAPPAPMGVDPLRGVAKELSFLAGNLKKLLGSGHPMLDTVAKYYTSSEGKYVRPMLVLLMSQATALTPHVSRHTYDTRKEGVNTPFTSSSVLSDTNPTSPLTAPLNSSPEDFTEPDILLSQRRLAEITELIHTASLLHDDVIDHSTSRRNLPSANTAFGNKMAVLAGDFLLGRASVALARLRDPEVTELLATVIANLVEGEFMQLRNTAQDEKHPTYNEDTLSYYLEKTYLKSASLISKSCRAAALLGGRSEETVEAAYQYGKNLGLAFQLVDDMLDYTVGQTELGKPAGADLELGLATAPLLFAWRERRELGELVGRKFGREGDVEKAREIVLASDGIAQTRALAQDYVERAKAAIAGFPDSDAKTGLIDMCSKVMNRRK